MSVKLSDKERLEHIIEAIDRIFRFRNQLSYDEFMNNEMAQFAIIKNFEIIGEQPIIYRKTYAKAIPI